MCVPASLCTCRVSSFFTRVIAYQHLHIYSKYEGHVFACLALSTAPGSRQTLWMCLLGHQWALVAVPFLG